MNVQGGDEEGHEQRNNYNSSRNLVNKETSKYRHEETFHCTSPVNVSNRLETTKSQMKRRFQRNRTSFGTEQITILEKGKLNDSSAKGWRNIALLYTEVDLLYRTVIFLFNIALIGHNMCERRGCLFLL